MLQLHKHTLFTKHARQACAQASHNLPVLGIVSLQIWPRQQIEKQRLSYACVIQENQFQPGIPGGSMVLHARVSMSDSAKDGHSLDPPRDDLPKDDPPAGPPERVTTQPPQLLPELIESLATQVTNSVLKHLAASGHNSIKMKMGSSSPTLPGNQGERSINRTAVQQSIYYPVPSLMWGGL